MRAVTGSFRTLAAVFGVSLGYVEKIFRQRKQNGKGERVRHRPGPKSRVSQAVLIGWWNWSRPIPI